jgi:iron complex transport system substrate-binding protein
MKSTAPRRSWTARIAAAAVALATLLPGAPVAGAPSEAPTEAPAEQAYTPVTVTNCGVTTTYRQAPQRAVTMNQQNTEIMLALGLQDRMIGTAYLDDKILPEYQAAYARIPVLATQYPSKEVLLAAGADFVFGGFASAFRAPNNYTREELKGFGMDSYLTNASCLEGRKMTMDDVYKDILDIGKIFGVEQRAVRLVAEMQAGIDEVRGKIGDAVGTIKVLLYDSETTAPYVAGCCGAGGMAIEMGGGTNIFSDLVGGWATANWEAVVERNPDVIILIEAEWSSAREKASYLLGNPALSTVNAIQNVRFVTVPFTSTSPGIRNHTLVKQLAVALYPEKFQ